MGIPIREFDPVTDPNIQYDNYRGVGQEVFEIPAVPGSIAISTLNGLSGPTLSISGGTTGLSFTPGGVTITLTGTLIAANGGTGNASYTKGDLLAASAATTLTKLAVASNYSFLTADSSQTTGLRYTKNNVTNTAPTANDDTSQGYNYLSFWVDITGPNAYVCVDPTVAAAVWGRFV